VSIFPGKSANSPLFPREIKSTALSTGWIHKIKKKRGNRFSGFPADLS
jgi:hypothetical protein